MASSSEERARQGGKGFGAPRQAAAPGQSAQFVTPDKQVGEAGNAAATAQAGAADQQRLALLQGGLKALQTKALEMQGAQLLLDAVQRVQGGGDFPEDPTLRAMVQQYLDIDQAAANMGASSDFFGFNGDTVTIKPLSPMTEADFTGAMEALTRPQNRRLLSSGRNDQRTLAGR